MEVSLEQSLSLYFTRKSGHFSEKILDVRNELHKRRKSFLGSYISVNDWFKTNNLPREEAIQCLNSFLVERTVAFWGNRHAAVKEFCSRFYEIVIIGLTYKKVPNESIDDIIQLTECLVRSRQVFTMVAQKLLPPDMIGELFDFVESYDESFYTATFEDAVLGAVSVLLGVLADPTRNRDSEEVQHG